MDLHGFARPISVERSGDVFVAALFDHAEDPALAAVLPLIDGVRSFLIS